MSKSEQMELEQMVLALDISIAITPLLQGKSIAVGVNAITSILAGMVKNNAKTKEELMEIYLTLERVFKKHLFEGVNDEE